MQDNLQRQLIEKFTDDYNKKGENVQKVVLLAIEVLEKDKIIEMMNIII